MKKVVNVVAAIIHKDNKILIAERGYGEFKGLYEFPGGMFTTIFYSCLYIKIIWVKSI